MEDQHQPTDQPARRRRRGLPLAALTLLVTGVAAVSASAGSGESATTAQPGGGAASFERVQETTPERAPERDRDCPEERGGQSGSSADTSAT